MTILGILALDYFLVPPHFTFTLPKGAQDLLLLLVGITLSLVASGKEQARRTAERQQRQAEQARQEAEYLAEALHLTQRESEREHLRLRAVLDVLPSAVIIAGKEGQLLEANPALTTLWGKQVPLAQEIAEYAQYKARWARTGQPLAPGDWTLARVLATGEAILNDEIEIDTADGQRKVMLNSAVPLRDETGAMTGAVICSQDISEVRRLEREVAERAEEGEAIFEAIADSIYVYDAAARIVRLNTSARALLGPEASAQLARPLEERAAHSRSFDASGQPLPLEHLPALRILHGEVFTGAQTVDITTQLADGRTQVLNLSGRPLRAAEGAITGAVLVARDVTERRRLEQEVATRAATRETILETITDGIGFLDPQGFLVQTNQAFRTLFGIELHHVYTTLPPLERLACLDVRNAQGQPLPADAWPPVCLLQGETLRAVDLRVKRLDGSEIVVNVSGAPIRNATGQILGGVEVFREVTEKHHLEQRTRDALQALVAMGEAMVQGSPTADRNADAEALVPRLALGAAFPEVATRLAELTRNVLGCQRVSMAAIEPDTRLLRPITVVGLPPDQEQAWWGSWSPLRRLEERFGGRGAAALAAGEPVLLDTQDLPERFGYNLDQAHSGLMTPMCLGEEVVGILLMDYGEQDHAVSSTEETRLTKAISRLGALVLEREQLRHRWAETHASELALRTTKEHMDTFLGMASHELKGPLTIIKLSLQMTERRLLQSARSTAEAAKGGGAALASFQEQLISTEGQVERLERLVNDLLDVSRIQADKLDLRLEQADLAAIVREAVEAQGLVQPDRTIRLLFPAELRVPVHVDAGRTEQVLTNYLTNALKYSPADRPVEVGISVEEQQARVWVRDQGPGLPEEEQERIWERFHRVPGIEDQSGTGIGLGLGLHICRTIIEQQHGQVGVESSPGKGSTFWCTVPLASAA